MAPHMGRLYSSENKYSDFSSFFIWDPNWDTDRERVKKMKMWQSRVSNLSSDHKATLLSALVMLRTFTCKQVTVRKWLKTFYSIDLKQSSKLHVVGNRVLCFSTYVSDTYAKNPHFLYCD